MRGRGRLARLLCSVAVPSRSALNPPCAPSQAELLRAVLSKLPEGALVSTQQLRSLMGVHALDLCGVPLKQVGGSWALALTNVLGKPEHPGRGRSGDSQYIVPPDPELQWTDPRPPPAMLTQYLGELVDGSTTWMTNDPDACDELVEQCGFQTASHIGLDTEWTPTMVRGQRMHVSMMQLATREHCLLLRVGQMPLPLPPRLRALLGASSPLKVGRGIRQDTRLIRTQLGADLDGVRELPGRESLKSLARTAGLRVPTGDRWMTNWDARVLPEDSLRYAAFDSIAAYAVHQSLPSASHAGGASGATSGTARRKRMRPSKKSAALGEKADDVQ